MVAIGLVLLPNSFTNIFRSTIRDALRPGRIVALRIGAHVEDWNRTDDETAEHGARVARSKASELTNRRLRIANQQLHEELQQARLTGVSPYVGTHGEPLLVPELVEARVIGRERGLSELSGLLITTDERKAITTGLPVLEAPALWVNQGVDADVAVGLPVYSGRCVVGRVAHAGKHVASVRLVTDREYRGRAQLARETANGLSFAAEGILEGTGTDTCRLKHIPATTAVSVGDGVYTGGRSEALPYPMYYGNVVSAELTAGAREWSIVVKPAAQFRELKSLHVLRQTLNSSRSLGN